MVDRLLFHAVPRRPPPPREQSVHNTFLSVPRRARSQKSAFVHSVDAARHKLFKRKLQVNPGAVPSSNLFFGSLVNLSLSALSFSVGRPPASNKRRHRFVGRPKACFAGQGLDPPCVQRAARRAEGVYQQRFGQGCCGSFLTGAQNPSRSYRIDLVCHGSLPLMQV